ncbi:enhancer of split malpha protein [Drosophila novamexicana]|uniref:enhancer of split malpha protein n=1 Tax=Drosophila novamexicana TaxID=47314 RepID=UPI0011E5E41A|nr:enhancer of split malpha protein [Drosophila novamexicana]
MCQQVAISNNDNNNNKMKNSYSIKQVLKTFFKKQQKQQQQKQHRQNSLESLESVDNLRNAEVEEVYYAEIDENAANEKLAQLVQHQEQELDTEEDIYVPVRFARTEAGTFFWTTNLQPVASVDADLLQPAYCYSSQQHPFMQYQDRWAQA